MGSTKLYSELTSGDTILEGGSELRKSDFLKRKAKCKV
jgi:hypothetical protein